MDLILEELGPNIENLLKMGMSGVVAALISASERLHIHEHKVCVSVAFSIIIEFLNTDLLKF